MIDHEAHLKQIFENQKTLSTDIQELNNVLTVKREQFLKLQGIVEYLSANGIKVEQPEQAEQVES